ncbi:MAG TPA: hypothetical protein VH413_06630 [Verrucomicrobiae bacterium]|jgi:hypothetical protein|nr:hypothetical protein [Verrucomicrobiae bacterium]
MNRSKFKIFAAVLVTALMAQAHSALACAACYGAAKGPLMDGMKWGIFALLGTVVSVLAGCATFFVYLAKKAASVPPINGPGDLPPPTQNT